MTSLGYINEKHLIETDKILDIKQKGLALESTSDSISKEKIKELQKYDTINLTNKTFESNFLGDDFLQYKGVLLKLNEKAITGFDFAFYKDLKYCQSAYDNNVAYPDAKYNFNTAKDSLLNKIFIVEDIIDKTGATYNNINSLLLDKPIFSLIDLKTKQRLYYKYDSKYDFNFPFNTSKILLDETILCSKIDRKVDDFTGNIKLNSPIIKNTELSSVIVYKDISKTLTSYYLSLRTYGSTVVVDGTWRYYIIYRRYKMDKSSKDRCRGRQ